MRRNSLAFRLFVAAAAWSLAVLPATAFILISVYRGAVESNFDARLDVYMKALVASIATTGNLETAPPSLNDPSFKLPFSGWYWQISSLPEQNNLIQASESLLDQRIPLPSTLGEAPDTNLVRKAYVQGPEKQLLRVVEREIKLDALAAGSNTFSVAIAGDSREIDGTVAEFRNLLIITLSILGLGLLVATFFQVQFGLRPLRSIREGLAAIRSGKSEHLEGDLPSEIAPLQVELNALIESNRAIVDRARTHVGNLAHALKTPLSVITNEAQAAKSGLAKKVHEQSLVMRQQIDHHLNRASIAGRTGIVSAHTPVKPALVALVRALERIYADRNLSLTLKCPDGIVFRGERQDLEEMAGNLLDNACKWADSAVLIQVSEQGKKLEVVIEDDGPGLPEKERKMAMKRGRRLDESKPGSGLGLSIVADLAHLYNGQFRLEGRKNSGLTARLLLPGA